MEIDSKTNLSKDQLVDYIKKQKLRIKRLEKEKEGLELSLSKKTTSASRAGSGGSSSTDPTLFWDLIGRENSFYQNLARAAINSLVSAISKSGVARQRSVPSKRALFERWKEVYLRSRAFEAEKHAEDANRAASALEQKAAKLKALLAKTHQANQRYQEDTTSFKKAQKEAAIQLKTLKERDETERMALMEAVRVRSIETAFQYDMEIAIQRAAEEMLSQQQQLHSQSQQLGSAKRIAALEEELAQVQQKLADCEDQLKSAKDELSTLVDRNAVLEKEIASRIESSLRNEQRAIECSRRLEEETRLRKDLEMELEITIRNRSEVIRELESVAEQRCARLKEHYTAEVNSMRAAMIFTDQNLEKAVAEAAALRNANKALIDVSVEVTQLRATVAELRRAAAASSSAIAMSSVPVSTAFGQLSQTSTAALSVYESLWPELIDIGKKAIKQSLTAVELYSDSNRLASKLFAEHILAADQEKERFRQLLIRRLRPDGSVTAPLPLPINIAKSLLSFLVRRLGAFDPDRNGLFSPSASSGSSFLAFVTEVFGSNGASLDRRVAIKELQLQRKIVVAEKKIARARARYQQIVVPIIFDASSMIIHAGKDLAIAIPVLRSAEEDVDLGSDDEDDDALGSRPAILWGELAGSIEWRFGGDLANAVNLTLAKMRVASEAPVKLQSKPESSGEFVGRFEINQRDGDRVLRLVNTSMWGSARVSYQIRTFFGSDEQVAYLERTKYEAEERLSKLLHHKGEFDSAVAEGQQLLRRFRQLIEDIGSSGLDERMNNVSLDAHLTDSSNFSAALLSSEKSVNDIRRSSMTLLKRLEALVGDSSGAGISLIEDEMPSPRESDANATAVSMTNSERDFETAAEAAPSTSAAAAAVPTTMIPATITPAATASHTNDKISIFSCESMKIKAADDFRLLIPAPSKSRVRLTWDFEILTGRPSGDVAKGRSKIDVGFAILEKRPDGSLPQIVPYRRVRAPGLKGEIIVDVPEYSQEGQESAAVAQENIEGEDGVSSSNNSSSNSSTSASSYFSILFDNSYSWYHKKEIKYHITLESVPEGTELQLLSEADSANGGAVELAAADYNFSGVIPSVREIATMAHRAVDVPQEAVGERNFLHMSAAHAYELSRLIEDVSDFWVKRERILRPFQD